MSIKAILYDMDGTLLPMDMKEFTDRYLKLLAQRMMKYGIAPDVFVKAMWAGCDEMVVNDGTRTNRDAFWARFEQIAGVDRATLEPDTDEFYTTDFHKSKSATKENPYLQEAIRISREKAPIVALATNPLFPMVAQESRLSWVGGNVDQFDLITSYETDSFAKPNPKYYESVCERLNVQPEECLMIGNDVDEDMYPASSLGMQCYLVTDTMIEGKKHVWEGARGTFAELIEYLKGVNA